MAGKKTEAREHHDQGILEEAQTGISPRGPEFHIPSGMQRHVCRRYPSGNDPRDLGGRGGEGRLGLTVRSPPCRPSVLLLQLLDQGAESADLPCGQGIKLFLLLQDVPI